MSKQTLRIAGIDWASEWGARALVGLEVDVSGGRVEATRLVPVGKSVVARDFDDSDYQRILHADAGSKLGGSARTRDLEAFHVIALDIPFGWPLFAKSVVGAQDQVSELDADMSDTIARATTEGVPLDELFGRRYTDEVVRYEAGRPPAGVSGDRLALGALAFGLVTPDSRARGRIDTTGRSLASDVAIIEVNPGATLEVLTCAYVDLWPHRSIQTGHGAWLRLRELEVSMRPPRLGPWVKFSRGSETQVRKPSRLFYRKKGEDEFVRYALSEWLCEWLKLEAASEQLEALSATSEGFDAFVNAVTGLLYAARSLPMRLEVAPPPGGRISVRAPDGTREAEFRRADGSSRDVFGYERDSLRPSGRSGGNWLATEVELARREGWIFFPTVGG